MDLTSQTLSVTLNQETNHVERSVASGNVAIDFVQQPAKGSTAKSGDKAHATGEWAIYTRAATATATNEVLELSGNPRLERADGWITATEKIVDDRTTGICHFIGLTRMHSLAQALTQNQTTATPKKASP